MVISIRAVWYAMYYLNNRYLAALTGAIITGLIVGGELTLAFATPLLLNVIYVALGELGVLVIGAFIFGQIENKEVFKKLL